MRGMVTVLVALAACSSGKDTGDDTDGAADTSDTDGPVGTGPDGDSDGYSTAVDCDDADPAVNPGADEFCDGVDSDCNSATAEPDATTGVRGVGPFATIGLSVAAAPAGGSVYVCGGTWLEVVTIDKDLGLYGVDGPTIDAGGAGPAIDVASGAVRIEGFSITGGTGSPDGPRPTNGGGINAFRSTGPVDVVGCEVHDNLADLGGGILFGEAGGTLVDSVVRDNVAGLYGGGVYATGDLEVSGSELADNVASAYGGGLVVGEASLLTVSTTLFDGNQADNGGGIFSFDNGRIDATDTVVSDNRATSGGGGIYLLSAELFGGTLELNDGGDFGGGVFVDEGAVEGTTIRANVAQSGAGMTLSGAVDLVAVTVEENAAVVSGGGIYAFDADVVVDPTTVVRANSAVQAGGGVRLIGSAWAGGTVEENDAVEGGGFYLSTDGATTNALSDVAITDNTATASGGGVFAAGPFSISTVTLLRNLSLDRGGGLYTTTDAVGTVDGSTLSSNSAVQRGGGMYANNGSVATVSDTSIDRNIALRGAGIYIIAASTVTLLDCVIEANGDATTISGGGARVTGGVLVSNLSDWGSALTDNVPDDVYVEGDPPYAAGMSYLGYEVDETFTCDIYACVPPP